MFILNAGIGCIVFGGALDAHPIAENGLARFYNTRALAATSSWSKSHTYGMLTSLTWVALATELTAYKKTIGGKTAFDQ